MTQNMKHTPGPYEAWPVKGDRLKRWIVVCVNPEHCPGTGKQVLAEHIRTESDARLFAAAPEMLAALKKVQIDWQQAKAGFGGVPDNMHIDWEADVDAALAKAGVTA